MPDLPCRRSGALRLVTAGLVLCFVATPVEAAAGQRTGSAASAKAAPEASRKTVAPIAAPPSAKPSATWTAGEPGERSCVRSRRKLWQDGEGWVVKRVSLCP